MSLTDPLLKSIKYLVQEFHSIGEAITDQNPYLVQLCVTLEQTFLKGLKKGQWEISTNKHSTRKRFWLLLQSFETDGPMPYAISTAINLAVDDKRIKTPDGRLRYVIRHCLFHRSLHVIVEFLMGRREQLVELYYENQSSGKHAMQTMAEFGGGNAIIVHEELAEQLRSLLLTCSTSLTFDIDLRNSYFLDESWQVPMIKTVEFVPSNRLGVEIVYIEGYPIVAQIKSGSLAAEELNLGVGDLLAEMNDQILFPATIAGDKDAMSVWRNCKRHNIPCKLTVIKPRYPAKGGIYEPLKNVLCEFHSWMDRYFEVCKKKLDDKEQKYETQERNELLCFKNDDRTPVLDPYAAEEGVGGKFFALYVGEISTGVEGGIDQIEQAIKRGIHRTKEKTTLNVQITLTQISVEVLLVTKNGFQPLFKHKYADISSCGKLVSDELHFCYIAGDTFCTISKQFKGFVFRAKTLTQARTVLNGIYQGFKRTTWFM